MGEINSFPIQTKAVLELDPITNAQTADDDKVLIYDQSVGAWKAQNISERDKSKVIPIDSIANFPDLDVEGYSLRQQFILGSFAPDGDSGGGILLWEPDLPKSLHDGVNYFSPTVPIPADFNNPTDVQNYLDGVGEEWPAGDGVFVLNYFVSKEEFDLVQDRIVSVVANLSAMPSSAGQQVSTKGCLSVGDGGNGTFIASATPVGPINGKSCIESATPGVYWNLQPVNGEYNVLQFGAVGDALEGDPPTGTDDTEAIRRANAFMKAIGGGVLNFLDRQYKVKRTSTSGESGSNPDDYIILIDYSDITLKFTKGKAKIIHDITDTDFTFARIGVLPIVNGQVSLKDVTIDSIEVDGGYTPVFNDPDGGHPLIIAYGVERLKICDFYLHHSKDYGIGLQNGGHVNCLIENGVIEDVGADGIDHKNNGDTSKDNLINNVTVRRFGRHSSPSEPYAAIDLMFGWKVTNVTIKEFGAGGDVGAGIRLKQGEIGEARGLGANATNIVNFTVDAVEAFGGGTAFEGLKVSARNCNVSNGIVENCSGSGVLVEQRKNRVSNVRSVGNVHGYRTRDSAYTTNGDSVKFVNCEADANTDNGFRIETDNVTVIGGSADSNDTNFSISSGATNVKFIGTDNASAVTKPVENTGSTTIQIIDCEGFTSKNTVESAPFAVTAAGTVSVTVPHGLGFDFDERFCQVSVRRSTNNTPWTITRLVLVSVDATNATYQVTIGSPSATGGDTATLLCHFNPKYIPSSL